jgi:antirestriction protein ArdC
MNVYEIITERILQRLEQGLVPWHKPWEQGIPCNLVTKTPYWLTLKQANERGGSINKGEKGTPVIF